MIPDSQKHSYPARDNDSPGSDAPPKSTPGQLPETGYASLIDEFVHLAGRLKSLAPSNPFKSSSDSTGTFDFLNLDPSNLYASLVGETRDETRKPPVDVVAARRAERSSLYDWMFDSDSTQSGPKGLRKTDLTGTTPDGREIHATGDATGMHVQVGPDALTQDKDKRKTSFESDRFLATDEAGVKSFTDKKTGFTTRWDSANNHGEVINASGKVAFTFDSRDALRAQITHHLKERRHVTQLAGEQDLDDALKTALEARKGSDPASLREQIFVDRNGNFAVITQDGMTYRTDRENNRVLVERDGHLMSVHDGKAFTASRDEAGKIVEGKEITDFAAHFGENAERFERGCRRINGRCQIDLDETRVDPNRGSLTTKSDTGDVDVTSGKGKSTVVNPGVADVTVDDKGVVTNKAEATRSVFSWFDSNKGLLNGESYGSKTFEFNNNSIVVADSNNGKVVISDDGNSYWMDHNVNLLDFGPDSPIEWLNAFADVVDFDDYVYDDYEDNRSFFERAWEGPTPEDVVKDAQTEAAQTVSEAATLPVGGLAAEEANLLNDIVLLEQFAQQAAAGGNHAAANQLRAAADIARQGLERLARAKADLLTEQQREFMQGDTTNDQPDNASTRERNPELT